VHLTKVGCFSRSYSKNKRGCFETHFTIHKRTTAAVLAYTSISGFVTNKINNRPFLLNEKLLFAKWKWSVNADQLSLQLTCLLELEVSIIFVVE